MSGAVGYYVHHHGHGHRQRAMSIAIHAPDRFTLIGTGLADLPAPFRTLDLPDDRPIGDDAFLGADGAGDRPHALHYAPLSHDGVRGRALMIADWIAREKPALMVVDVSVEIAMLARLCATPTVYIRLAGDRTDPAHLDAFRGASALVAPFHIDLDDPAMTGWIREKTRYFPGLTPPEPAAAPDRNVVLVAFGRGGAAVGVVGLVGAASASPDLEWRVIGPVGPVAHAPANLNLLGWVDDAPRRIAGAGVVVAGAGDGVLNAIAAAGRPYVCVPEARPYGEQAAKARRLRDLRAAIVLDRWPEAAVWPRILGEARRLDPSRLSRLHDPEGAAKAAAFLMEVAR